MAHVQLANGFILSDPGQLTQALATAAPVERMISLTALNSEIQAAYGDWLKDRKALHNARVTPQQMFSEFYEIIARVTGDDPEDLAFPSKRS